ncbi:MAG: conjugal transfer protein TraR [Campylobacterales bacterium]|nr:conjugal transfer protein TraR [Campylobacterales bacterium]
MHTRNDLNHKVFEKMLIADKKKIISNIESLKAEINALVSDDDINDVEDMADLQINNTSDQALLHRLETELAEINAALSRIKLRVYGICEKTAKKIPIERLIANPSARTVVHV